LIFPGMLKKLLKLASTPYTKLLENSDWKFKFRNKTYKYFYHPRSYTYFNERAVEIPIFKNILDKFDNQKILEVGSTLCYYISKKYNVVDKYDVSNNIMNKDILNYNPREKYDLIISISTLEHVGWDEDIYGKGKRIKDPKIFIRLLKHLKKLLSKNGVIIFSVPIGYNAYIDRCFRKKEYDFDKLYFLKRTSPFNTWKEAGYKEVKDLKHNNFFGYSRAIAIGVIQKGKTRHNIFL